MSAKKSSTTLKMFITDGGELFSEKDLAQYAIPQSKQLDPTPQWGTDIIAPPYDPVKLMAWLESNVIHNSCVRQKVQDSVGIGWHLSDVQNVESKNEHYQILYGFFNKVNNGEDINAVCKKVFLDYEANGNGCIEVARGVETIPGVEKYIAALYHVNSTTVRWHKDKDKLVQIVNQKKVYFKPFGEARVLNKETGVYGPVPSPEKVANEMIYIRQYTHKSYWYGAPEWLPAIFSMYGQMKEQEYNLDFFANYGVPAYAVVITNIVVNKDIESMIKKYFETEVKGNPHKTMVFGLPKGGEVKFERLSVETKEASFRIYRRDNRDDILTAHHVPPYRVGIVQQGQLGGSVSADMDRIYLDSVINPRQKEFEWIINQLLVKEGFGIEGWQFRFDDIDIEDRKMQADIDNTYFNMGVLTPNEMRKRLGKATYEGGDDYYVTGAMIPVGNAVQPEDKSMPDIEDYIKDLEKAYELGEEISDYNLFLAELIEKGAYHRARVVDPGKFQSDSLRTIWISQNEGIKAIVGRLKNATKTTIQAYLFDKTKWTTAKAKQWLKDHDVKTVEFVEAS
jgi:PBSX family phage portal protein